MLRTPLIRLLLGGVLLCGPSSASAAGFYNLPTNLRQCLGIGFGPGYHAPLLLGNPYHAGTEAKPIKWLPHGLAPPVNQGFAAAPTTWTECGGTQCDGGQCLGGQAGVVGTSWESYTHQGPGSYGAPLASNHLTVQPMPPGATWSSVPAPRLAAPAMPATNAEVVANPQPTR